MSSDEPPDERVIYRERFQPDGKITVSVDPFQF
jgi:hypothetical protein